LSIIDYYFFIFYQFFDKKFFENFLKKFKKFLKIT